MNILLFGKGFKEGNEVYLHTLMSILEKRGVRVYVNKSYKELLEQQDVKFCMECAAIDSTEELKKANVDFVFTLGGDGTILTAITLIKDLGIPILGINLGRLGFLAIIEKNKIERALDKLFDGRFTIGERVMLKLNGADDLFGDKSFALNDFTLHKRDTSAMIKIHSFIDGSFLNSYWADGLIVSTPTGSTGYSLSCGGPIVFPYSGNFVITPVAPHDLNVRPVVLSDNRELSFIIEGRGENFLCTLDSRFEVITSDHKLSVRKCDFRAKLVQLEGVSFQETIHNKLFWGKDSRN
ncbi:NAD kinase [Portibacter marinus]|uniref:NAD kinase n=1 Tax=Portibacter marinus TaxID=2898660 RepID=UPI001F330741|nr:NAD kinase [Portibacter marinus]